MIDQHDTFLEMGYAENLLGISWAEYTGQPDPQQEIDAKLAEEFGK